MSDFHMTRRTLLGAGVATIGTSGLARQPSEESGMTHTRQPEDVLPAALQDHWYNAARYQPDRPLEDFEPSRAALVLIDLINWQTASDGASVRSVRDAGLDQAADYLIARCAETVLPNLHALLPAARNAGVQVIHARLASRHPDYLDIVPALRAYVRAAGAQDGSRACEPLPGLAGPRDLSVVKSGSGAFTATDLDALLRRLKIDTVLYAGVVTNACVMLTVAGGFDLGYRQYLITDCTGALSEKDQSEAERFMRTYLAEPVGAAQVVAVLRARGRS